KRSGRILQIKGVDVLNGTPLLDLKPFAPEFDNRPHASSGWLSCGIQAQNADSRFSE
ncbi:MAG: TrmO family methyltransferase, partial [Candidatus Thorarchaeota archaeon]